MSRVVQVNALIEHAPRRDAIGRLRCKCGWPSSDVAPSQEAFGAHVEAVLREELAAKGLRSTEEQP